EAGRGRLVPGRKAQVPGQLADLGLVEPRLRERAAHARLGRRAPAGPEVAEVVHDHSVGDVAAPLRGRGGHEAAEQLGLAVVAAVRLVARVERVLQLVSAEEKMPEAEAPREA